MAICKCKTAGFPLVWSVNGSEVCRFESDNDSINSVCSLQTPESNTQISFLPFTPDSNYRGVVNVTCNNCSVGLVAIGKQLQFHNKHKKMDAMFHYRQ